MFVTVAFAFGSISGGAAEYHPPKPSKGQWPSEEDFGPGDEASAAAPLFTFDPNPAPPSSH